MKSLAAPTFHREQSERQRRQEKSWYRVRLGCTEYSDGVVASAPTKVDHSASPETRGSRPQGVRGLRACAAHWRLGNAHIIRLRPAGGVLRIRENTASS
jgi:hypothetical protein